MYRNNALENSQNKEGKLMIQIPGEKNGVGIDIKNNCIQETSFELIYLSISNLVELATTVKIKFVQSKQPVHSASGDARVRETTVALKNLHYLPRKSRGGTALTKKHTQVK